MAQPEQKIVKPGHGVLVDRSPLGPWKEQLRTGIFPTDSPSRRAIQAALRDPDVTSSAVDALFDTDAIKTFRNAYVSEITEQIWVPYHALTVGEGSSLYKLGFDRNGRSFLNRIPEDDLANLSSSQISDVIAESNQGTILHLICSVFEDGKIPVISGDPQKDREYFAYYQEQTDLGAKHNVFHIAIPEEAGTAPAFIVKGLGIFRTHINGLPNLIDTVAEHAGIELDPDNHRKAMEDTMRRVIAPYYLPTFPIIEAFADRVMDLETRELIPERFTHNGDADSFIIFPDPAIVADVNDTMASTSLPVQTNCPIFPNKVAQVDVSDVADSLPLPRYLESAMLAQLDRWYYPKRREEWSQRR